MQSNGILAFLVGADSAVTQRENVTRFFLGFGPQANAEFDSIEFCSTVLVKELTHAYPDRCATGSANQRPRVIHGKPPHFIILPEGFVRET